MLAARVRSEKWAGSLLEEWLMDMRGDSSKLRGRGKKDFGIEKTQRYDFKNA